VPITCKRLRNLVARTGCLVRSGSGPDGFNGHLQPNDVWQYRVGDVRDLAARAAARRAERMTAPARG